MFARAWVPFVVALAAVACSSADPTTEDGPPAEPDLVERLRALPHVTSVQEAESDFDRRYAPRGYRVLDVGFDQPLDHDLPGGPHFTQRVRILHWHSTSAVVLTSSGYHLTGFLSTIAAAYSLDQIEVEHRYFGASRPEASVDPVYAELSVRQAARDFHEIATSLKGLYRASWIGFGASKGGATAVFHRMYFPEDTAATVAYVTPFIGAPDDARFPRFLREVGGDRYASCRAALTAYQRAVLARREEVKPLMSGTYEKTDRDEALEFVAVDYAFGFWANVDPDDAERGCPRVPKPDAPAAELGAFLESPRRLEGFADDTGEARFEPYVVQARRELGNYGRDLSPFEDLLRHRAALARESSSLPAEIDVTFDAETIRRATAFVASGERFLFVYGEYDPWTAARLDLGQAKDSFLYVVPGANHGAEISQLDGAKRSEAQRAIERWAAIPVAPP